MELWSCGFQDSRVSMWLVSWLVSKLAGWFGSDNEWDNGRMGENRNWLIGWLSTSRLIGWSTSRRVGLGVSSWKAEAWRYYFKLALS